MKKVLIHPAQPPRRKASEKLEDAIVEAFRASWPNVFNFRKALRLLLEAL